MPGSRERRRNAVIGVDIVGKSVHQLGWSQEQLVARSEITKKTIADFERGATTPYPTTLAALRSALQAAGVEFLPDNGVRLRQVE